MNEAISVNVEHVSKTFRLPHEKTTSIKSAVVNFYKRKKTFEAQQVLKNVSFEIKKGEFFGIVGRNGSGKSTLLKMLAGIYSPTEGIIHVEGKLTPFIELGVGFNPELTGRENVFLNGALLGFNRTEMREMYDDIVEFAEIEKFMDQKLKNYSSGMQVRLAFSIAIRAETDILLLDEVLAVGDAAFQQKCFNYFEELKRTKRTVIFVSHDMNAIRRFCTSAVYIKDGSLIRRGTPSEIADIYLVENIKDDEKPIESNHEQGPRPSTKHKISRRITKQETGTVELEISYESKDNAPMYAGISLIKDGTSIAEIVTSNEMPLIGNGKVQYVLDTSVLNGGIYQLSVALFDMNNRELISYDKIQSKFIIKGSDITRGAALKLADTWKQA